MRGGGDKGETFLPGKIFLAIIWVWIWVYCDLYAEMVQDQQKLMLDTNSACRLTLVHGYKILRLGDNPQKLISRLLPTKNNHLKVYDHF